MSVQGKYIINGFRTQEPCYRKMNLAGMHVVIHGYVILPFEYILAYEA